MKGHLAPRADGKTTGRQGGGKLSGRIGNALASHRRIVGVDLKPEKPASGTLATRCSPIPVQLRVKTGIVRHPDHCIDDEGKAIREMVMGFPEPKREAEQRRAVLGTFIGSDMQAREQPTSCDPTPLPLKPSSGTGSRLVRAAKSHKRLEAAPPRAPCPNIRMRTRLLANP